MSKLGTVIDMEKGTCYHAKLQTYSTIVVVPSGHWAIDLLDFPDDGWKNPYLNPQSENYLGPISDLGTKSAEEFVGEID